MRDSELLTYIDHIISRLDNIETCVYANTGNPPVDQVLQKNLNFALRLKEKLAKLKSEGK